MANHLLKYAYIPVNKAECFRSCFSGWSVESLIFALHIILLRDVRLLRSDLFLQSEFLIGLSVGVFKAAEESNPRRYACKTRADWIPN